MEAPKERLMTNDVWYFVFYVVCFGILVWAINWVWEEYKDHQERRDRERETLEELRRRLDEQDNGNPK
jgi:hypothetical protein